MSVADMEWVLEQVGACLETWTMPAFLEGHTLHDGTLAGIRWDGGDTAVVGAKMDLFWNPGIPERHDLTVFVFRAVYALRCSRGGYDLPVIGTASAAPLGYSEREALFEDRSFDGCGGEHPAFDEGLTRTHIQGVTGFNLEILHGPEVLIACAGPLGRIRILKGESHGP